MPVLFIIGRVLLGGFFLYSGWKHFKNLAGYVGYAQSKRIANAKAGVIATGVALTIGGLSILSGFFIILGMWLLVLTLLAITFMVHAFWKETDPGARSMEVVQFTKNIAIIGALLMLSSILVMIG
jgi:putative oxidoreductase